MTQKTFAFVVYPGLTLLDLAGPLQVITGHAAADPSVRVAVVGETLETTETDTPLRIAPSHTFDQVPDPSWVLVPGGGAPTLRALGDEKLIGYLRRAATTAELMTSVCTGSLLLGQAGLLEGREATTHWTFLETLRAFGATPVRQRWADTGSVITAAGVSAGIDLALHLVERMRGEDAARLVQFGIEYDPRPPLGPLDWSLAPRERMRPFVDHTVREGLAGRPELRDKLLAQR
ncbi:DJ-1/PfpI family protein [Amycolatopsis rubida]|uniref:DJ-1/PfpI family protein n=1 Tax=Amycolatopsis rubida TaxID=112413 RepID=A0A1I5UXB9_9PSEU|nr:MULTISPECIES: DJ-1/PfpI family protein [Amycolatopsis]MYW90321.1 DJ-1/PfpI family protein [Amycolatopsis rubida]NEC55298.1 DJ-1/PfpI family protein [Amycolatopsis rubida]OAP26918.1 Isonitrile hydratase [Amycolatopsis sp. M39]SFP99883.1 DJ-1/PfpI family protein [Amycolatopsis rubida]